MDFILTIDTEADNQWDHGRELTVENIRFVPEFQKLCEKHGIRPTYLVTSEVCEDEFARKTFTEYLDRGTAEIGAHLHSWTTPPFTDQDGLRYNDPDHAFASELPEEILNAKVLNLTNQITEAFGKRPLSFRSGRFGFNDCVAKSLISNSYLVDSSVTPFSTWVAHPGIQGNNGGPDFTDKLPFPYRITHEKGDLVEIPLCILPTSFPLNLNHSLAKSYFTKVDNNIFLKVLRKLFYINQPAWLRPFDWMNLQEYKSLIKEAFRIELPFMVMMFHSSELMPGCSRYRPTEDSVKKLFTEMEGLFLMLKEQEIRSVTLSEAAENVIR